MDADGRAIFARPRPGAAALPEPPDAATSVVMLSVGGRPLRARCRAEVCDVEERKPLRRLRKWADDEAALLRLFAPDGRGAQTLRAAGKECGAVAEEGADDGASDGACAGAEARSTTSM